MGGIGVKPPAPLGMSPEAEGLTTRLLAAPAASLPGNGSGPAGDVRPAAGGPATPVTRTVLRGAPGGRAPMRRTGRKLMGPGMYGLELVNYTGHWYGPDGTEITAEKAAPYMAAPLEYAAANTVFGRTPFTASGVWTMFVPFDLKPLPGVDHPPHLWGTVEWHTARRFGRKPRKVAELTHRSQTRTQALAAHDQAVTHMRQARRADRRKPWRWIYWPNWLTVACTILGMLNFALLLAEGLIWLVRAVF